MAEKSWPDRQSTYFDKEENAQLALCHLSRCFNIDRQGTLTMYDLAVACILMDNNEQARKKGN